MHRNETKYQCKETQPSVLAELRKRPFLCILLSKVVANLLNSFKLFKQFPFLQAIPLSWLTASLLAQQSHLPCVAISHWCSLEAGELPARDTWYLSPAVKLSDSWLEQSHFKVILQKFSMVFTDPKHPDSIAFFFHLNRLLFYLAVRIENIKNMSAWFFLLYFKILFKIFSRKDIFSASLFSSRLFICNNNLNIISFA